MGPTQTDNRLRFHGGSDTGATTDVACDTSHANHVPKLFGRSSRDRRVLGRWAAAPHCLASASTKHHTKGTPPPIAEPLEGMPATAAVAHKHGPVILPPAAKKLTLHGCGKQKKESGADESVAEISPLNAPEAERGIT